MTPKREAIVGGVSILEYLTRDDPVHERNAAKRVFAQVVAAWPGDLRRLWWKWFAEAASSMGQRTKTLDCSVDEAVSLARDRAQFVCFRETDGPPGCEWLGVLASSERQFQVLAVDEHETTRSLSKRGLRNALAQYAVDGRVRCVVIQPTPQAVTAEPGVGKKQIFTPLDRLWKLLRPEASDIALVAIFAFVVSLLTLATPMAVEALVNTVAFGRFLQPILILALILLTFLGFQSAVRALQTFVVEIIQRRLFARVSGDLAYRLPRIETEAADGEHLPELVNRFFDIVTVQKVAAQLLLDGVGLAMGAVIGMAVLGFYHPFLLGFDLFLLCSIAVIIFVLGRGAVKSAVKESKHKYYMASWLEDIARCPATFRNDGGADFALERADRLIHEYLEARRGHFYIVMRQVLFALGLQAVASTVLLGLGGWLVVSGELTLGQLVAAELIVTVIVGSFAKFGKHMESFYDLLASVDKLGLLFDLTTERQDGMLAIGDSHPARVQLNSVGYSQHGGGVQPIRDSIDSGQRVALLGGSGAGKSTLLDLIFGLRRPTTGQLTIDGFDPHDLRPDVLRSRVALARGAETFHSTVEENVHLHREGVSAAEVRDVLASVGLLNAILNLPKGMDAMLTSDGAPLSDSEKRLLSIARAAIGKPGLLLIDGELDGLCEAELNHCLDFLTRSDQPWTLIVATSRADVAARLERSLTLGSVSEISS